MSWNLVCKCRCGTNATGPTPALSASWCCVMFRSRTWDGLFWQAVKLWAGLLTVMYLYFLYSVARKMSFVKVQERTAVRFIFTLEHKVNHRILESSQSRVVLMIKEISRVTTLSCWWAWEDLLSGLCFFFIAWALSNLFFFPFYLSLAPAAEKVTSLGKDWHKFCLKCERCNKTLTAGGHAEVSVSNVCGAKEHIEGSMFPFKQEELPCFLNHSSMKDSF